MYMQRGPMKGKHAFYPQYPQAYPQKKLKIPCKTPFRGNEYVHCVKSPQTYPQGKPGSYPSLCPQEQAFIPKSVIDET
jgi:hypothetical protein